MNERRLTETLENTFPDFNFANLQRDLEALTAARALAIEPAETEDLRRALNTLLNASLFSELALDLDGRRIAAAEIDLVAHALTQGMDLLRPGVRSQLENAELAASLFSVARQTPKAVAVLRTFEGVLGA